MMVKFLTNFRMEMQSLGYVEGEVNAFIHDIVEDRELSKLSDQEWKEITNHLTSYLAFAKKCKKVSAC